MAGQKWARDLHTKILKIASDELGIEPEFIKVTATNTSKVPNTSATAASSGSDLNGMAVKNAIGKLKSRLAEVAVKHWAIDNDQIKDVIFRNNEIVIISDKKYSISFKSLFK